MGGGGGGGGEWGDFLTPLKMNIVRIKDKVRPKKIRVAP